MAPAGGGERMGAALGALVAIGALFAAGHPRLAEGHVGSARLGPRARERVRSLGP